MDETVGLSIKDDERWEVSVELTCPSALRDELWPLYESSFQPLREEAAQRHLLTRAEFDDLLQDERMDKILVRDRTETRTPAALGVITNQLDAVSLVSSDYYRRRWPEHHRQQRIWYVVLTAVAPAYQGSGAVARVFEWMCRYGEEDGAIIAADICEFNERERRFPYAIARLCRAFNPGIRQERLDAQVYWAYELPAQESNQNHVGA